MQLVFLLLAGVFAANSLLLVSYLLYYQSELQKQLGAKKTFKLSLNTLSIFCQVFLFSFLYSTMTLNYLSIFSNLVFVAAIFLCFLASGCIAVYRSFA